MTPQSVKAKGRALQNRVARDLARVTGLRYGRPDEDECDVKGRLMGTPGPDIVRVTMAARRRVPWFIECKARRSWTFDARLLGLGSTAKITLYTWLATTERRRQQYVKGLLPRSTDLGVQSLLVVSTGREPQLVVYYRRSDAPPRLSLFGVSGSGEVLIMAWQTFLAWQYPQVTRGKEEVRR